MTREQNRTLAKMAEYLNKSVTKVSSAKRASSGKVNSKVDNVNQTSNDLLSREQQYKQLNDELEAKTATLVREAEEVMRQDEYPLTSSLLGNVNSDDFLLNWDGDGEGNEEEAEKSAVKPVKKKTAQQKRQRTTSRTKSAQSRSAVDDVAMVDDASQFSLGPTIAGIERRFEQGLALQDDSTPDVLPAAANEMGTEAQMRFLKAKLRVMQEELDRLAFELNKKEEQQTAVQSRAKELEEEKGRLSRTAGSLQTQLDKFRRLATDAKSKTDTLEAQLGAVRKEVESMKRDQKQQGATQNATEVRLNRAMEEVDRHKQQLSRAKSASKESTEQEKTRVDQLLADNRRLEKQKNELMTGFKKQLKLIDILKRQKMHIEAAKMLSFTEEEFVKALEWGT